MSEAEKNKKLRLEIANGFEKQIEERLELAKQTMRGLKTFATEYAAKDARIVRKLEKFDEKGSEAEIYGIAFPDPFVIDETLESLEAHIDDLKENLELMPSIYEDIEETYKEENAPEDEEEEEEDENDSEGEEEDEGDDGGEDDGGEEDEGGEEE